MDMGRELAIRRIANDRRRTGDFIADPVEHPAIHARHWGSDPVNLSAVHGCAFREICVQFHSQFLFML
jgi:hypothetical protein